MQKFIVAVLLACLLYLAAAQDAEFIKSQIIAQYNQFGGSSVVYPEEVADVIDPAHINIHL